MKLILTPSIGMVNFPASELTNYKTTLLNKSGVYAIYNPVNGKYYIGSSVNLWYRIRKYGQISNITRSPHRPINKAIVKYGFNNLIIIILEFHPSPSRTLFIYSSF